jgi:hypothetical protein
MSEIEKYFSRVDLSNARKDQVFNLMSPKANFRLPQGN